MLASSGYVLPGVPKTSLLGYGQQGGPWHMYWESGAGECGRLIRRLVTHLFFSLIWTVPGPMESAGVVGEGLVVGG